MLASAAATSGEEGGPARIVEADQGGVDRIAGYFENKCLPCDHVNAPVAGELA